MNEESLPTAIPITNKLYCSWTVMVPLRSSSFMDAITGECPQAAYAINAAVAFYADHTKY